MKPSKMRNLSKPLLHGGVSGEKMAINPYMQRGYNGVESNQNISQLYGNGGQGGSLENIRKKGLVNI